MDYIDLTTNDVISQWDLRDRFSQVSNPEALSTEELENTDENDPAYMPRTPNNPIARLETTYPTMNNDFYTLGSAEIDTSVRPAQRTFAVNEKPVQEVKDYLTLMTTYQYNNKRNDPFIFNGTSFDYDDRYRLNIQRQYRDHSSDPTKNLKLRTNVGQVVTFTATQFTQFADFALGRSKALLDFYDARFDEISAATTIADLIAVDMTTYVDPT